MRLRTRNASASGRIEVLVVSLILSMTANSQHLFAQTSRDSEGVQRHVYEAQSRPKGSWKLSAKPSLVLDALSHDLLVVTNVAVLSDGNIVVTCENDFREFDKNGKFIRSMGRLGPGPGEFVGGLVASWRIADTVIGMGGDSRVAFYSPAGKLLRTEQRPTVPSNEAVSRVGYFANGSVVGRARQATSSLPTTVKTIANFTLWLVGAGRPTILGVFPSGEFEPQPGGPPRRKTFGPSGHAVVLREAFCTGFSSQYAVSCFDLRGKLISRFERRGVATQRVTGADKEYYFDIDARANPGPLGAARRTRIRQVTQFAEHHPFFGRMMASRNDLVWIGPAAASDATVIAAPSPEKPTTWSVFSSDGEWLSDVVLPKRFLLMEAGSDYVAGVQRDEDDAENVVIYTLNRSESFELDLH